MESSTARRISASSAPSRTTMRKTNVARPIPAENSDFAACFSTRCSISVFQMPRHAVHPNNHGDDKNGRDQKHHAFKSVFADLPALQRDGHGEAGGNCRNDASPHPAHQIRAARCDSNKRGRCRRPGQASTPSRRAMRKEESKKQSFSLPCRRPAPIQLFRRKEKQPAPKIAARSERALVATHSQLGIQVYTQPPASVKVAYLKL